MVDYTGMTPEQIKDELIARDAQLETSTSDLASASVASKTSAERIKSLEEHNQKLFLKVTTKVEDKTEEEEEKPRTIEDLVKEMGGKK